MINEEKIKAATDVVFADVLSPKANICMSAGFIRGIEWFKETIWHDAKEEPEYRKPIIVKRICNIIEGTYVVDVYCNVIPWKKYADVEVETFIGDECTVWDSKALSFLMPKRSLVPFFVMVEVDCFIMKEPGDKFSVLYPYEMAKMYESYDSILDIVKVEYKEVSERYEIIENLLKGKTPQGLLEEYGPQKTVTLSGIDMVMDKYLKVLKDQIEAIEEEEKNVKLNN